MYLTAMQTVLDAIAGVDACDFEEQVQHVVNLQIAVDIID